MIQTWLPKKPNRVLDIGASTGIFMETLFSTFNCEVIGIEPGESYRQYFMEKGFKVYNSIDTMFEACEPKFDIITMSHVLEHLSHPLNYLNCIRESVLIVGGNMLIEVPNLYGHACFEPGHLISFTPRTIERMLERANYKITKLKLHRIPNDKTEGWRYITVLVEALRSSPKKSYSLIWITVPIMEKLRRRIGLEKTRHLIEFLYIKLRSRIYF